jgi:hypothetical protein
MSTAFDRLLVILPTSRDLSNLIPALPQVHFQASLSSCIKCLLRTISKVINGILTRILKNPNQSIAICFLLGMSTLFFLDKQYPTASVNSVRGSFNIKTDYTVEAEADDEKPTEQHAPLISLPAHFNYLTNSNTTLRATPVFWSIPRSGGTTVRDIMGKCRGFVIAGAWIGFADRLQIVYEDGMKQVTADLSSKETRIKARDQGLKDANPNILLLSSNVFDSSDVFSGSYQAELWAWFRHPVERQISNYFWAKSLPLGHPQYHPSMQMLSLTDWAQTQLHTPNAMLAALLGVPTSPMGWTEMDLTIAKNLIRKKAKIGLLEQKTESIRRFLHVHNVGASGARECQDRILDYAWSNKGHHDAVGKKTDAYQLLLQSNSLDMKLYDYATYLFDLQAELFVDIG